MNSIVQLYVDVMGCNTNIRGFIMKRCKKLIQEEVAIVKKIQQDEIWLEGERRHASVDSNDDAVKSNINRVISGHIAEIEIEAISHCYDENNEDCRKCRDIISKK